MESITEIRADKIHQIKKSLLFWRRSCAWRLEKRHFVPRRKPQIPSTKTVVIWNLVLSVLEPHAVPEIMEVIHKTQH